MARLTPRWTKTTEEAFGKTGYDGLQGELFLMKVFESWGWEATHHESDRIMQLDGKDITFKNPKWFNSYTCDVKANLNDFGKFYVPKDKLFSNKCDRMFHVNPRTGWIVWYGIDEMKPHYDTSKEFMEFTIKKRLPFMQARKTEVLNEIE